MKKILYATLAVSLLGGAGFADSLEQSKNDSGLKFSETGSKGETSAVPMSGDFQSAPKAQTTALAADKAKLDVPAPDSKGRAAAAKPENKNGWKTAKIAGAVVGGAAAGGTMLAGAVVATAWTSASIAVAPIVIAAGVGALVGYGVVSGAQWVHDHVSIKP